MRKMGVENMKKKGTSKAAAPPQQTKSQIKQQAPGPIAAPVPAANRRHANYS